MLFTFQPDPPMQTTRTPISARMAQMSQVQELFHEAAQQNLGRPNSFRELQKQYFTTD